MSDTPSTEVLTPPTDPTPGQQSGETQNPQPSQDNQAMAAQRLAEDKARLAAENAQLKAQLAQAGQPAKTDEEIVDGEFRDITIEKVAKEVADSLANLPESMRSKLSSNPWAYVDRTELETALTAGSRKEAWNNAKELAVNSIKELASGFSKGTTDTTPPADAATPPAQDPTIPISTSGNTKIEDMTEGQLAVLQATDPAKFALVRSAAKRS